jgi:hypothetical protein
MVQGNHLEEPGFSLFSQVVMYQQLSTLLEYHGICWTHSSCAPPRNAPNPLSKKCCKLFASFDNIQKLGCSKLPNTQLNHGKKGGELVRKCPILGGFHKY